MERCYKVTFDTQRDRQYISWAYYTIANNQKEAKKKAEQAWHNPNNKRYQNEKNKPHMFHVCAERYNTNGTDEDTRVCNSFYIERSRYANWG